MNIIDNIKKPILTEMQLFGKTFAEVLSADHPMLDSVNEYVLQKSDIQLRPLLTLLSAKMFGKVNFSTIDGAISLELLHIANLIHDDVSDNRPDLQNKLSANERWTNKIAILSGDYILSKSLRCATRTDNLSIFNAIASVGMMLSDGELLQLANNRISETSENIYFNIIRKKTALLFSTCSELGGISVNADKKSLEHLRNFGEFLGICLQLKEDISFYRRDTQIKNTYNDGTGNWIVTLPLIYAYRNATETSKKEILSILSANDFSLVNFQAIQSFVHENVGIDNTTLQMELYKNKAIEELNGFADGDVKKSLLLCVEFATN